MCRVLHYIVIYTHTNTGFFVHLPNGYIPLDNIFKIFLNYVICNFNCQILFNVAKNCNIL